MKAPVWLLSEAVVVVQEIQIDRYGGSAGLRDEGLLESALARPVNKQAYDGKVTVFDLAAAYGFGLARNHPFVDGNKRIAFAAMAIFLSENGYELAPEKMDALETIMKLAAGDIEEDELAGWVEANSQKL
ncbi:MAG: type II toxin-antitoxin system death-on-curing family toxin [Proteobacteria bacterium]|nr:type II toxin-antitoxin system death-on-curing family toxin [Pseudomonadota bacterium]MDA1023378.1 type II toxin-antitoxin system death-on-curing family toxin [Pseudomonadota bacterium]